MSFIGSQQISLADSSLISTVADFVKEHMKKFDGSHDYSHIERVVTFAHKILVAEQRDNPQTLYNPTIVTLGALLHDAADEKYAHLVLQSSRVTEVAQETKDPHSFIYKTHIVLQSSGATQDTRETMDPDTFIYNTLISLGASSTLAATIQTIVPYVSLSHERKNPEKVQAMLLQHPELGVIQDADRLDAVGLTGMVRAMIFGGIRARPTGMQGGIDYVYFERAPEIIEVIKTKEARRLAEVKIEAGKVFKEMWDEEAEEAR